MPIKIKTTSRLLRNAGMIDSLDAHTHAGAVATQFGFVVASTQGEKLTMHFVHGGRLYTRTAIHPGWWTAHGVVKPAKDFAKEIVGIA